MRIDRNVIRQEVSLYAHTLLDAAYAEDAVFDVGAQLGDALKAIRGSVELSHTLEDESIPAEKRADIIRELFKDDNPLLVKVLGVMAERGNIGMLPRVKEEYDLAAEEKTGIIVVDVTTAVPLDDRLREAIKQKMSADFGGKEIMLSEHIDKSIIGGVVLDAHGKRIDASVQTQLEKARIVLSTIPGGER